EAVLAEVPAESVVVIGGDVVWGPMPAETLAGLRELGQRACFIRGNADRGVTAGSTEFHAGWVRDRLDPAELEFLEALDDTVVLDVDGLGPTLFCHASPRSDLESITMFTPDDRLRPMLAAVEQRTVVWGHTHRRFGSKRALEPVDFALDRGGFLVVTGPNGSGKTTLLRLCAGLLIPTAGTIEVAVGRGQVGYLAHEPLVYRELTAVENLDLYGR